MAARRRPPSRDAARVNLMPRSEVARRERDKLIRAWVWGVLGAILVALLIVAAAFWLKWTADQRLAAEQAQTNQLLTEIASLAEVSQALATESELTDFRTEAMATDLAWAPVIAKVTGVLPAGHDADRLRLRGRRRARRATTRPLELGLVGTVIYRQPDPARHRRASSDRCAALKACSTPTGSR